MDRVLFGKLSRSEDLIELDLLRNIRGFSECEETYHSPLGTLSTSDTCTNPPLSRDNLCVIASGRLNNIPELARKLGYNFESDIKTCQLEEIIALSYLKWGRQCSEHFLGDFAFCIWDDRIQHLFCSRDHLGVKPFYYTLVGDQFYFSSSLQYLLNLTGAYDEINIERVVDYCTSVCLDNASTFYNNIFRLPPAHSMTIRKDTFNIRIYEYWKFEYDSDYSFSSDEEYAEEFRELFSTAVRCRIDSCETAVTLSGGLDSTSIACIAKDFFQNKGFGNLHVYSGVFDTLKQCDEREYIRHTLDLGNFSWHTLTADSIDPLESLFEIAKVQKEPWFAPHMFMNWNLLIKMKNAGIKTLMDGHDGDTVVSYGWGHLSELIDNNEFLLLLKELILSRKTLTYAGQKMVLKQFFKRKLKWKIPNSFFIQNRYKNRSTPSLTLTDFLSESLKQNPAVKERIKYAESYFRPSRLERINHQQNVFHPIQPFALETLNRTAASFSIDYRCPFWDKRLVEFCLSLPARQKFQNGFPRSIQRRSMERIIPPKVQWRQDKSDFSANMLKITDMVYEDDRNTLFEKCRQELSMWVDFNKLITYYRAHPERRRLAIFDIWKILTLYAWLKTR